MSGERYFTYRPELAVSVNGWHFTEEHSRRALELSKKYELPGIKFDLRSNLGLEEIYGDAIHSISGCLRILQNMVLANPNTINNRLFERVDKRFHKLLEIAVAKDRNHGENTDFLRKVFREYDAFTEELDEINRGYAEFARGYSPRSKKKGKGLDGVKEPSPKDLKRLEKELENDEELRGLVG